MVPSVMRLCVPSFVAALVLGCAASPAPPSSPRDGSNGPSTAQGSEASETPSTAPSSPFAAGPLTSDSAQALVDHPSRSKEDREKDARRHPAETLVFLGLKPGQRVADLGAGDGYTTELIARAVGEEGVVYAQNNADALTKHVGDSWPGRLARPTMTKVVRVDAEWEQPLPKDARDLDLVTVFFSYHDVIAQDGSTTELNMAVLSALKVGGHYVIADHQAPEEGEACPARPHRERQEAKTKKPLECVERTLHRVHRDRVIYEVTRAGFELVEEGEFLRDPTDDRSRPSFESEFKTDRFLLKFKKVREEGQHGGQGRIEGMRAMLDDGSSLMTPYTDEGLDFCAMYFLDLRGRASPHRPQYMKKKCRKRWAEMDAEAKLSE